MRQAIDTAPRDGKIVILEDDASGTYDVAHWSAKAGTWVGEKGEPSKITPTHWYQRPRDQYFLQEDDRSPRRFAALPMAATLMAVGLLAIGLVGLYFQVVDSGSRLLRQDSHKTGLLALEQLTEADHARVKAGAQVRQAVEAPLREARPPLTTGQLTEVLADGLADDRRAIDRLDRQPQAEAANSAQLLGQERQNGAAARQELTASTAQHRQALDEERARSAALANELAMARRENEAQATQLRKASEQTGQLKQVEAANRAQSLEQERQKTAALAQDAAAARQELIASTAKHRQALDEERARQAAQWSELAAAQREIETQATQLRKASEEIGQLKQTVAAESGQSLEQERQKMAALAQDAAAARQELIAGTAKHRQALDEERARQAAQWSELAAAQREIEAQATQLRKASEEIGQLKQTVAADSTQPLERERQKMATLVQEAAAARQELTASMAKHRQALDEERARSAALTGELATERRENEMQTVQLRKTTEEMEQFKQATEGTLTELRQSLQQERGRTEVMAREIQSARRAIAVRVTPESTANSSISKAAHVIEAAATAQPPAVEAQESPEATRLIARARTLLGQGNIGAARIVLDRAAETGSAVASFTLAETYDPVVLSTWGTYGTRGDAMKARELYARAHAGGILDAKDRLERLDQ